MMGSSAILASAETTMRTLSSNQAVLFSPSWNLTSTQSMNGMTVWLTALPTSVPDPMISSGLLCGEYVRPSNSLSEGGPETQCPIWLGLPRLQGNNTPYNVFPMRPNSSEWCLGEMWWWWGVVTHFVLSSVIWPSPLSAPSLFPYTQPLCELQQFSDF